MSEHRAELHGALQRALHDEDAGQAQGNLVTGWVVVVESMDPDGRRWLSRIDGGPGGDALPEWHRQGLLFNALHSGGWEPDPYDAEPPD